MTNCCKLFLATISAGLAVCLICGCESSRSVDGQVDLRKASDQKISIHAVYDRIEVVCLDNVPENATSAPVLSDLSVTGDRFFLRDGDRAILSYRQDGHLAAILNPGVPIKEYAVYKDRILDVLSEKEVYEYLVPEFSFQQKVLLNTDNPDLFEVTPVNLVRLSEEMMMFPAEKGDKDYWGEYHFDTNKYYVSPGKKSEAEGSVAEKIQLFCLGDKYLALFPYSGQIWELGDFVGHYLWLDFKQKKSDVLEFLFAQVSDDKVYYSILLNGEPHFLIYNRSDQKYVFIKTTREGLTLPLGVIRNGINFYCCPSKDLPKYVSRDLLDSDSVAAVDRAVKGGFNAMIKYHLD